MLPLLLLLPLPPAPSPAPPSFLATPFPPPDCRLLPPRRVTTRNSRNSAPTLLDRTERRPQGGGGAGRGVGGCGGGRGCSLTVRMTVIVNQRRETRRLRGQTLFSLPSERVFDRSLPRALNLVRLQDRIKKSLVNSYEGFRVDFGFRRYLSFAVPTLSTQTSPGSGMVSPSSSPPSPTVSFSSGITTPSIMQLYAQVRVEVCCAVRRSSTSWSS